MNAVPRPRSAAAEPPRRERRHWSRRAATVGYGLLRVVAARQVQQDELRDRLEGVLTPIPVVATDS